MKIIQRLRVRTAALVAVVLLAAFGIVAPAAYADDPEPAPWAEIGAAQQNGDDGVSRSRIKVWGWIISLGVLADTVVAVQSTDCLGNSTSITPIYEDGTFEVEVYGDYPDGACTVTTQAFVDGSPTGEPFPFTVRFAPEPTPTPTPEPTPTPTPEPTPAPSAWVKSLDVVVDSTNAATVSGVVELENFGPNDTVRVAGLDCVGVWGLPLQADGSFSIFRPGPFPGGRCVFGAWVFINDELSGEPVYVEVNFADVEPTPSPTPEPTSEPTPSPTPVEPTPIPEPSPSPTPEPTPTVEPTPTPTLEPTPSPSPTVEPSPSPSPTATPTATPTASPTPTVTPAPTQGPGSNGGDPGSGSGGSGGNPTGDSSDGSQQLAATGGDPIGAATSGGLAFALLVVGTALVVRRRVYNAS